MEIAVHMQLHFLLHFKYPMHCSRLTRKITNTFLDDSFDNLHKIMLPQLRVMLLVVPSWHPYT